MEFSPPGWLQKVKPTILALHQIVHSNISSLKYLFHHMSSSSSSSSSNKGKSKASEKHIEYYEASRREKIRSSCQSKIPINSASKQHQVDEHNTAIFSDFEPYDAAPNYLFAREYKSGNDSLEDEEYDEGLYDFVDYEEFIPVPLPLIDSDDSTESSDSDGHSEDLQSEEMSVEEDIPLLDKSTYYKPKSNYNFNIRETILDEWRRVQRAIDQGLPFDSERSVIPHEECTTKKDFAETLLMYFDSNSTTIQQRTRLLQILSNSLGPFVDLPFVTTLQGAPPVYKQMLAYCTQGTSTFQFACCPQQGCCVFVGNNKNLKRCPHCRAARYSPCTREPCKSSLDVELAEDQCTHTNRKPEKVIRYRSMLLLFHSLLCTPNFLDLLNYKYHAPTEDDEITRLPDYQFCDILDGSTAKGNLKDMHEKYLHYCESKRLDPAQIREVPILLSHFYDGIQLYKKKVMNFWPLLIQILTLPPTFRSKKGVGIFTIGLFTGISGSKSDDFLLTECFAHELHLLNKGVAMNANGIQCFLQVRVIAHQMDTKGYEKVMKCQSTSTALTGCPMCYSCCGRTHPGFGQGTYFINHRINLVENHQLRLYGSGLEVCDWERDQVNILPQTLAERKMQTENFHQYDLRNFQMSDIRQPKIADFDHLRESACPHLSADKPYSTQKRIDDIYEFGVWYHDTLQYGRTAFNRYLSYQNCELREQIPHVRKSNNWYMRNGLLAEQYAEEHDGKRSAFSGIKGLWFASTLEYAKYDDTYWCTMHVLKNIYLSLFSSLTGKKGRDQSPAFKKYCKINHMFYTLFEGNDKLPAWGLDKDNQQRADAYLNAILLPSGYSNCIQVTDAFQHPERTNSHACKMLLMVLLPYVLDRTDLGGEYKIFFHMLAEDLIDMYRPNISEENIEDIHNRILETVCIHEGMFPPYECTFSWHQLIDLPHMIRKLSTLEGWTGFWGEKHLGILKRQCPGGGASNDATIMNRIIRLETAHTTAAFSTPSESDSPQIRAFRDSCFDRRFMSSKNDDEYTYTFHRITPVDEIRYTGKPTPQNLSDFESQKLLLLMIDEIRRQSRNRAHALEQSGLFRLHISYTEYFYLVDVYKDYSFQEFVQFLYNRIIVENVDLHVLNLQDFVFSQNNQPLNGLSCKRGAMLIEDVKAVYEKFLSSSDILTMHIHKKCSIFGVDFRSRGFQYRERHCNKVFVAADKQGPKKENTKTVNILCPENVLRDNWHTRANYSSWCKYRLPDLNDKEVYFGIHQKKICFSYAHINSFHTLQFSTEPLLQGLVIASVTSRSATFAVDTKTGLRNSYPIILTKDELSFNKRCPRFVCCKDIIPTPLAVVGIVPAIRNENGRLSLEKPWANLTKVTKHGTLTKYFSSEPSTNVSKLHLIDLFPYNDCIHQHSSMYTYYVHEVKTDLFPN